MGCKARIVIARCDDWEGVKQVARYFTMRSVQDKVAQQEASIDVKSQALHAPTQSLVLLLELRDHGVHAETVRTRY